MQRRRLLSLAALGLALTAGGAVWWWTGDVEAGPVFSGREDGVAIRGTDPVAYFTQGAPVMGTPDHASLWRGATWWFATAEHKRLFDADPERYAPRYGGFCAFAAANGRKAKIEPDAWSIVDGRLYLNYDLAIRERWESDREGFIAAADREWPKIVAAD